MRLFLLLKERNPKGSIVIGYIDIPAFVIQSAIGSKGLPEGIVNKLQSAFSKAMAEQIFIEGMQELRLPSVYRIP